VENILGAGRKRRVVNGVVLAGLAVVISVVLVIFAAGPAWFGVVFVLTALAALMLLQAREST
jgi:hypothetical protein